MQYSVPYRYTSHRIDKWKTFSAKPLINVWIFRQILDLVFEFPIDPLFSTLILVIISESTQCREFMYQLGLTKHGESDGEGEELLQLEQHREIIQGEFIVRQKPEWKKIPTAGGKHLLSRPV